MAISRYDNVTIKREGTKLVIECELDPSKVNTGPSASGKTTVFATTGGNRPIDQGFFVGLTVYKKA